MQLLTLVGASAIAISSLLQPVLAGNSASANLWAEVFSAANAAPEKRDAGCDTQILTANLTVTLLPSKGVHIEGLPSSCVALATNSAKPLFGTLPTDSTTSTLTYANLTQTQIKQILHTGTLLESVNWDF